MTNILYARHALERVGATVMEIPQDTRKTPDLLASFGNRETILIEEKTKEDSREYLDKRLAALAAGEIHSFGVPQVRSNRLSGIVRSASKQLSCPVDESVDLRLVWFTATGTRAEATYEQFIATLYGTTRISELNSAALRRCYFFRNSDFHRYRGVLDGAVVAHVSGETLSMCLCLNPLSPNYHDNQGFGSRACLRNSCS